MPDDPTRARPAQDRPPTHVEPAHPGPASHVEKQVRKDPAIDGADKRRLGEEASREEDA
jgi:hypothetical protein